jgi:hypothetical protein
LNAGFRYTVSKSLNILVALGRTVTEPAGQDQELLTYLGFQLEL